MKGKDGFTALSDCEQVVDEENGVLISIIIRQYFLSLKAVRKWRRGGAFRQFFGGLKRSMTSAGQLEGEKGDSNADDDDGDSDEEEDEDELLYGQAEEANITEENSLVKKMGVKWARLAGVKDATKAEEEYSVDWTRRVAPAVEGRIQIVGVDG